MSAPGPDPSSFPSPAHFAVFLSLGSNLGDRKNNLTQAVRRLHRRSGQVARVSGIYLTEAWGFSTPDSFLNLVLRLDTPLLPEELLIDILAIEKEMGRDRKSGGYENRLIDIDILLYGKRIVQTPSLTLPHPFLHLRRFVLVPLAEIAPGLLHPRLNRTVEELLQACTDKSSVEPYAPFPEELIL